MVIKCILNLEISGNLSRGPYLNRLRIKAWALHLIAVVSISSKKYWTNSLRATSLMPSSMSEDNSQHNVVLLCSSFFLLLLLLLDFLSLDFFLSPLLLLPCCGGLVAQSNSFKASVATLSSVWMLTCRRNWKGILKQNWYISDKNKEVWTSTRSLDRSICINYKDIYARIFTCKHFGLDRQNFCQFWGRTLAISFHFLTVSTSSIKLSYGRAMVESAPSAPSASSQWHSSLQAWK